MELQLDKDADAVAIVFSDHKTGLFPVTWRCTSSDLDVQASSIFDTK